MTSFDNHNNMASNNHITEWKDSAISDELISLNLVSVDNGFDVLFIGDKHRINTGCLSRTILNKYAHLRNGGWYCRTYDPFTDDEMLWVQFKPNTPRHEVKEKDGIWKATEKVIKYESPLGEETRVIMPFVSDEQWQRMSIKYNVKIGREDKNFWQWIRNHKDIPLVITEGSKKTLAVLSQDTPCVGIVGVRNGTEGTGTFKKLRKDFRWLFKRENRKVYVAFDQDNKLSTISNVNKAKFDFGIVLGKAGQKVHITKWSSLLDGKGIDDVLVALEPELRSQKLEQILHKSESFALWSSKYHYRLREPNLLINSRYLGDVVKHFPDNRLIALKAPHGTGKSQLIAAYIKESIKQGIPCYVIVHLESLAKALADDFGVYYRTEYNELKQHYGYSLCIDSCYPKFNGVNPENLDQFNLVIDEVEQVLDHQLNGDTDVSNYQILVLDTFSQLLKKADKIFIADADLSNVGVECIENIAETKAFIIENEFKYEGMSFNSVSSATALIALLLNSVESGQTVYINTTSQKAKSDYGAIALENLLKEKFPHLANDIIRIDSETVKNVDHQAYNVLEKNLDEFISKYKIVIISPVIQTGKSINIRNHFDIQFNFSSGNVSAFNFFQQMWRLRDETVPRWFYTPKTGFTYRVNGSSSPTDILKTNHAVSKATISLLSLTDSEVSVEEENYSQYLATWAKINARHNAGMRCYRELLHHLIEKQGHTLTVFETNTDKEIKAMIANNSKQCQFVDYQKTIDSPEIDDAQAEELEAKQRKGLTESQMHSLKKHKITKKYDDINFDILEFDDDGNYPKLRLFYYLTLGKAFVKAHDKARVKRHSDNNKGKMLTKDLVKKTFVTKVKILEIVGLIDLVDALSEKSFILPCDDEIQSMYEVLKKHKKALSQIGVSISTKPLATVNSFLKIIGHKLTQIKDERGKAKATRVDDDVYRLYELQKLPSWTEEVLNSWHEKDLLAQSENESKQNLSAPQKLDGVKDSLVSKSYINNMNQTLQTTTQTEEEENA